MAGNTQTTTRTAVVRDRGHAVVRRTVVFFLVTCAPRRFLRFVCRPYMLVGEQEVCSTRSVWVYLVNTVWYRLHAYSRVIFDYGWSNE